MKSICPKAGTREKQYVAWSMINGIRQLFLFCSSKDQRTVYICEEQDTTAPEVDSVLRKGIWHQWIKTYKVLSTAFSFYSFSTFFSFFLLLFLATWDWFWNSLWFSLFSHLTTKSTSLTPYHSKSFWRALTDRKEEKTEDVVGVLHSENAGICALLAFRIPRNQVFSKCALLSLLSGEDQQPSIAGALCSTLQLAYLGTGHLLMTTR